MGQDRENKDRRDDEDVPDGWKYVDHLHHLNPYGNGRGYYYKIGTYNTTQWEKPGSEPEKLKKALRSARSGQTPRCVRCSKQASECGSKSGRRKRVKQSERRVCAP